jgi:hypothetical protein
MTNPEGVVAAPLQSRPGTGGNLVFRALALTLLANGLLCAWTMSVEFPFAAIPRSAWERDLTHLKETGVAHVSLPATGNAAQLDDVIRVIRRLGLEADLEGPLPERLELLAKSHGGALTEALAGAVRISATMPRALDNERKLLTSGTQAIVWTDVFETLIPYHPGAITLAGAEVGGANVLLREAQVARFWGAALSAMPESPGARPTLAVDGISVHQYIVDKSSSSPPGLSLVSVVNDSSDAWKGEIGVMYPALQRPVALPAISVSAHDVIWLPVNIPLTTSTLCPGCNGFAPSDRLFYATAELTDMEYENGVLAMEFMTKSPSEVVLQLSHEPTGPLVAGGHPAVFDWDEKTSRARLPIPAGNSKTGRVRIALAIDAPSATAFFPNASVLLIGETNRLTAEFSPPDVAARSRLRTTTPLNIVRDEPPPRPPAQLLTPPDPGEKDKPVLVTYKIGVPSAAVAGDTAQLAIDADGTQLSHAKLRILPPATVVFEDAVAVRLAPDSSVTLYPASIPVNQKPGREIVLSIRNNAPEIRTFDVAINVPGLDFSPAKTTVSVGASVARDVRFRVFSSGAAAGVHEGMVGVSGAATFTEPVRFVVVPSEGAVDWSAEGFSFQESARTRTTKLPDRWLEMIDKESGKDDLPAGGVPIVGGRAVFPQLNEQEQVSPGKPAPVGSH